MRESRTWRAGGEAAISSVRAVENFLILIPIINARVRRGKCLIIFSVSSLFSYDVLCCVFSLHFLIAPWRKVRRCVILSSKKSRCCSSWRDFHRLFSSPQLLFARLDDAPENEETERKITFPSVREREKFSSTFSSFLCSSYAFFMNLKNSLLLARERSPGRGEKGGRNHISSSIDDFTRAPHSTRRIHLVSPPTWYFEFRQKIKRICIAERVSKKKKYFFFVQTHKYQIAFFTTTQILDLRWEQFFSSLQP